jgi:hypothetical protein
MSTPSANPHSTSTRGTVSSHVFLFADISQVKIGPDLIPMDQI